MVAIYALIALVVAMITSALTGLLGTQDALSVLLWGIAGANVAILSLAMCMLCSVDADSPDGLQRTRGTSPDRCHDLSRTLAQKVEGREHRRNRSRVPLGVPRA